jgi:hypothetical protein
MASKKWLASCHRRSISTMHKKVIDMSRQWQGMDAAVINEFDWLAEHMDNLDSYLYFLTKDKKEEKEK